MRKLSLLLLLAFSFTFASAQITITPGVQRGYDLGFGIQPLVFVPDDYFTTDPDFKYRVVVFLSGIGETDSISLKGHGFPRRVGALGFNGKQPLPNSGDTAKYIVLSIHYDKYVAESNLEYILDWFIDNFDKVDTSRHDLWTITGLSMGSYSLYHAVHASLPLQGQYFNYHNVFTKCINASTTWQSGIFHLLEQSTKSYWLFHGEADVLNNNWHWQRSQEVYDVLDNAHYKKFSLLEGGAYGHNDAVWDSMTSPHGDSYENNVWIWMAVVDTLGSDTLPPPTSPSLQQAVVDGNHYLYFLGDTAQRSTLKHYFIYNVIDSSAKDSAYAVQRGLVKKYYEGWDGKQPLCDGDTAVFHMVTQLDNPILNKAALEHGIQWALDTFPDHVFDTTASTNRMKNIFTGMGWGATSLLVYLMEYYNNLGQGSIHKFSNNFGVYISVDHGNNGYINDPNAYANMEAPFKSWWWSSSLSTYPYQVGTSRDGADNLDDANPHPDTKLTEIEVSYSSVTWDSAYSTHGGTAENNIFRWIDDSEECVEELPAARTFTRIMEMTANPADPSFNLYPNPVSDQLVINWNAPATKKAEICIIDLQGKILYKKPVSGISGRNVNQVPVRSLAPGQYIIRLTTDKEVFVRKFVKQ